MDSGLIFICLQISRPWYSGHVLTRPDSGGTGTDYKITCWLFDKLEKVLILALMRIRRLLILCVIFVGRLKLRLVLFITTTKYMMLAMILENRFDGVSAKEALEQLSEFATDFVYGVDEYREFFFMATC